MPDSKITALASIGTGTDPAVDPLVIVDVSDTSMAASGTTKKVTLNNLLASGAAATFSSATVTGNGSFGGSLSVTGALTSYTGQVPSAIRAAASDYAAVTFDGATASTRIAAPCQALGTGDFSLWSRIRVPATGFASGQFPGIVSLSDSNATASRTNGFRVLFSDTGSLQVSRFGSTTSDIRTATISGFRAAYSGQVIDINVTRAGATLKIYINGTDTAYTETTAGTAPAWSDTIVSDFVLVGCTSSAASNVFVGRIYRSVVFNRALSAADVTEVITTGVNQADQWGTQTGQTSGTLVASKRYRITTYVSADSFTNVGAASNATGVEFVATGTTPTTWTNGSTLNRIGGLVDLDFTVGAGYQAHGRSTNNLHGTLFNGVEFTVPKKVAVLYATTNTNGNQQMLGTLAIPTNAIIEDIIVNSTGSATVSIGNASAGTQIVNGASVVSGRQKLTLATPFSTTGNLWVNSNSTATLQFTILYTIAS